MSDISPVNHAHHAAPLSSAPESREPASATPRRTPRAQDSAELSDVSVYLSRLSDLPEVRADLVDRVRAEIARDEYLTDDKLTSALDELDEDLGAL